MAVDAIDDLLARKIEKAGIPVTPDALDFFRQGLGLPERAAPPAPAQAPVQARKETGLVDAFQGGFAGAVQAGIAPNRLLEETADKVAPGMLGRVMDSAAFGPGPIGQLASTVANAALTRLTGRGVVSNVRNAAEGAMRGVAENPENVLGEDASYAEQSAGALGNMLGFSLPQVATAILSGGTSVPVQAALASWQGASTEFASGYYEAKGAQKSEPEAWGYALVQALGGATEGIGALLPVKKLGVLAGLIAKADAATGGGAQKAMSSMAVAMTREGVKTAGQEFGQEFFQGAWSEVFRQAWEINPEDGRKFTEIMADVATKQALPTLPGSLFFGVLGGAAQQAADTRERIAKGERMNREGLQPVAGVPLPGPTSQEAPGSTQLEDGSQVQPGAQDAAQRSRRGQPGDPFYKRLRANEANAIEAEVEAPAELASLSEAVAKRGQRLRFVQTAEGGTFRGAFDPQSGDIVVNVNRPDEAIEYTVGHELTHALKTRYGGAHQEMVDAIRTADPEGLAAFEQEAQSRDEGIGPDLATEEGAAYYVEEVLGPWMRATVRDPAKLEAIARDNRTTFRKIVEAVLDVINTFTGTKFNTYREQVRALLGETGVIGRKMPPAKAARLAQQISGIMGKMQPEIRQLPAMAQTKAQELAPFAQGLDRIQREAGAAVRQSELGGGIPGLPLLEAPRRQYEDADVQYTGTNDAQIRRLQEIALRRERAGQSPNPPPRAFGIDGQDWIEGAPNAVNRILPADNKRYWEGEMAAERRRLEGEAAAERLRRGAPPLQEEMFAEQPSNIGDQDADAMRELGNQSLDEMIAEVRERVDAAAKDVRVKTPRAVNAYQAEAEARRAEANTYLNELREMRRRARGRPSFNDAILAKQTQLNDAVKLAFEAETKAARATLYEETGVQVGDEATVDGVRGIVSDVTGPYGKQRVAVRFDEAAPQSDIDPSIPMLPSQERLLGPRRGIYDMGRVARVGTPRDVEAGGMQARSIREAEQGIPPRFSRSKPAEPTRKELLTRRFVDSFKPWEDEVRKRFNAPKGTYIGVAGKESIDPVLGQRTERNIASRDLQRMDARFVRPLDNALRRNNITLEQIGDVLYAMHAEERNIYEASINPDAPAAIRDRLSGMPTDEADAILKKWKADPRWPEVLKIVDRFQAMQREDLKRRFDAGLLSKEEFDSYTTRFKDYVPLRTDMDDGAGYGRGSRGTRGREFQAATGRTSKADNPFVFGIAQSAQGIVRSVRNTNVLERAAKFVETMNKPNEIGQVIKVKQDIKNANGDVVDTRTHPLLTRRELVNGVVKEVFDQNALERPEIVPIKRNGEQWAIVFADPARQLADTLKRTNVENLPGIMSWFQRGNAVIKRLTTIHNPIFGVINGLFRDPIQTIMRQHAERGAGFALNVLKDIPKMGVELARGGKWAKAYEAAGGFMPSRGNYDFKTTQQEIERTLNAGQLRTSLRVGLGWVDQFTGIMENQARLAVFKNLVESGTSVERAALGAQEANVNFGVRGEWAPFMDALYAFWGANVAGSRGLYLTTKGGQIKQMLASVTASAIALDMMNRMLSGDDDTGENAYDKISSEIKDSNIIFMVPGTSSYVKVPSPPGFAWLFNAPRYISEAMWGPSTTLKAASKTLANAIGNFNPMGANVIGDEDNFQFSEAGVMQAMSPTLLDPAVQALMNADWRGKKIHPENLPFGPGSPDSELYYKSRTSNAAAVLTRELNRMMDFDDSGKADIEAFDISPATIQHLIKGYLPGVIQEGMSIGSLGEKALRDDTDIKVKDFPLVRRLFSDGNPYQIDVDYRDIRGEVQAAKARYDELSKSKERARAIAWRKDNMQAFRAIGALNQADRMLSKLPDGPEYEPRRQAIKGRFLQTYKNLKP